MHDLSRSRWEKIGPLLDACLDRPEAERARFLNAACRGEPTLRAQVDTLLGALDDAPAFLDDDALGDAALAGALGLADSSLDDAAAGDAAPAVGGATACSGSRVGPYELICEIGRGGMGTVFRAKRADGAFEQEVAIKLLSTSPPARVLDRFQQEQQALASLNHPNIARLYDGGTTEDGRPYLVMELVRGERLTDHCEKRGLDLDARLDFAAQAAASLQHAHVNLIIHRDIKPSNILVAEDGAVKLLDFGIAKLLRPGIAADLTRTGEQLLTPRFAAPEQLRHGAITVATDVYQLGIVLYELLAGEGPFEAQSSLYEIARTVCERMPPPPSAALAARLDAARAARRPTVHPGDRVDARAERRLKALRGDLDAIVLKALAKDPANRYPTMQALLADLEAYRGHRPVAARRPSVAYRLGKTLRRHRLAAAAASAIAALTLAYAIDSAVQAQRTRNALARAEVEADKAARVADYLVDLFKLADPNVADARGGSARELLDEGRERLGALHGQPELEAQLASVLGEIYYSLGDYRASVELLERALDARRAQAGADERSLADTKVRLGISYNALDRYVDARGLLSDALAAYERLALESPERGEALNAMGAVLRKQGDHAGARERFEQAVDVLRRATGGEHYELAVALNNLAALQVHLGELASAERNMREAATLQERLLGERHSYVSVTLNNLGAILVRLERYDEAEALHRRALALQLAALGDRHSYVGYTYLSLGLLMHELERLPEAEDYLQRAVAIHEAAFGRRSAAVANALAALGRVLLEKRDYARAGAALDEALEIDAALFPGAHPKVGRDLTSHAALAHARGDVPAARASYERAIEILAAANPDASRARVGYARLLLDAGDLGPAERYAREALELRSASLPDGHGLTAEARALVAAIGSITDARVASDR